MPGVRVADPQACQCGEVLKGVLKPCEGKVFGTARTPEMPIGICTASPEVACATYDDFGRLHRETAILVGRPSSSDRDRRPQLCTDQEGATVRAVRRHSELPGLLRSGGCPRAGYRRPRRLPMTSACGLWRRGYRGPGPASERSAHSPGSTTDSTSKWGAVADTTMSCPVPCTVRRHVVRVHHRRP